MNAEVIAFGDELTTGQRLDTNSRWLAERLTGLGVAPAVHTTIGDDLDLQAAALRAALDRADVVVCTGGLGPTDDDLTREAIAAALDRPLELREELLRHLEALFTHRGRIMPERNRKQATLPAGARPIPNPHGTAPGVLAEAPRVGGGAALIAALPGVPAEMRQMWDETVGPLLAARGGGAVIAHRRIKCFGLGESELESRLGGLIARGRNPLVGITVHQATITLRITARAAAAADAAALIAPVEEGVRTALGDLVFGEEDEELPHIVARVLAADRARVAVLDCVTGGLLGMELAQVDSAALAAHLQTPTVGQAFGLLRVEAPVDAGDEAVAAAAARAVRETAGAEYGLALVASADPEWAQIALTDGRQDSLRRVRLTGHPEVIGPRAAKTALDLFRRRLLGRPLAAE